MSAVSRWVCDARGGAENVLVRALVGPVFLSEGVVEKFLFSDALGAGRFAKIGIPFPTESAPLVGVVEIVAGTLLTLGLLSRLAAVLLLVDTSVAIVTTKVPMLGAKAPWATANEARTDWAMLFGLLFLLAAGGGRRSVDAQIARR